MGGYQTRDYSGNYYGICHCQHCQKRFDEMFGLPLPEREDADDPHFANTCSLKARPCRRIIPKFTILSQSVGHTSVLPIIPTLVADLFARNPIPELSAPFRIGSIMPRITRNGRLQVSRIWSPAIQQWILLIFHTGMSTVSPHQQSLRLAQNLANGGALDYYLIGRLDNHEDRSGYAGVKDIIPLPCQT